MKSKLIITALLILFATMFAGLVIPAIVPYSIAAMVALSLFAVVFVVVSMNDHKQIVDDLKNGK